MKTALLVLIFAVTVATSANAGIFDGLAASNTERLKMATSEALGSQISFDDVTIIEVKRGMTSVKWKAKTPTGIYSCIDDDMMRGRASCAKEKDVVATEVPK